MRKPVLQFYEEIADEYHLMFSDWKKEVVRQGEVLDHLIRRHLGPEARSVLDCACGIGTQAIGLATRGYAVHATDLSPAAVERAKKEAESLGAAMTFDVADFRTLEAEVTDTFDVVLCCDNSLSHLLEDEDLLQAASQIKARLKPGGMLLASIRDYDQLVKQDDESSSSDSADPGLPGMYRRAGRGLPHATMPSVFDDADGRRIAFQIWDWAPDARSYTVNQFFVRMVGEDCQTTHYATHFRALLRGELSGILQQAGFSTIDWQMPAESGFYQPIVLAR